MHAELDTNAYPTGVTISDERMAALPLHRHTWHPDWNYTLDPHTPPPTQPAPATTTPTRPDRAHWAHPALTGMSNQDFTTLADALLVPYQAHREARLHIARGGPPRRKPAGGYPPALTVPEMLLVTVPRARFGIPRRVLAQLFGLSNSPITKAETEITPLLAQRGHTIEPTDTRLHDLDELTTYAAAHGTTLDTPPTPRQAA